MAVLFFRPRKMAAAGASAPLKRFALFISNPRTGQDMQAMQLAMTGPPSLKAMFAVHVAPAGGPTPLLQDNVAQIRTGSAAETMFQIQALIDAATRPPATGGAGGPPGVSAAPPAYSIAAQAQQAAAREALLRGTPTTPGGPVRTSYPSAGGGTPALPPGLRIDSILEGRSGSTSGLDDMSFRSPGGMGVPGGTQSRFTGGGMMTLGTVSSIETTFASASESGLMVATAEQIASDPTRAGAVRAQAIDNTMRAAFAPIAQHIPDGKFSDKSLGPARDTDFKAARDRHDAAISARLPAPPPATAAVPSVVPPTGEFRRSDYVPQSVPF